MIRRQKNQDTTTTLNYVLLINMSIDNKKEVEKPPHRYVLIQNTCLPYLTFLQVSTGIAHNPPLPTRMGQLKLCTAIVAALIENIYSIQYQNSHPAERYTSPHDLQTNSTQDLAGVGACIAQEPFDIDTNLKIEGIAHQG